MSEVKLRRSSRGSADEAANHRERRLSILQVQLQGPSAATNAEDKDRAKQWREARWRPRSMENRFGIELGPFHDVGFLVGLPGSQRELITCHKIILARCSEVFSTIFFSGPDVFSYDDEAPIVISDILPVSFNVMIDYVYSGEMTLVERFDEACSLLYAAKKYDLPGLATLCRPFLWSRIYPGHVWTALDIFTVLQENQLYEAALQIMQRKTSKLLEQRSFEKIPHSVLLTMIQQEHLTVDSEQEIYSACVRWARAEAQRRRLDPQLPSTLRGLLGPVLKHLNFLALHPDNLGDIGDENLGDTVAEALAENLDEAGNLQEHQRTPPEHPSFFAFGLVDEALERHMKEEYFENTYDVFSQAFSSSGDFVSTQLGIQISTQIPPENCSDEFYDEDFTIFLFDFAVRKMLSVTRFAKRVKYNSVLDIPFSNKIKLDRKRIRKVVKVIFHKDGIYPSRYISENGPESNELQCGTFNDTEEAKLWHKASFNYIRFCAYTVDSTLSTPEP